MSGKQKTRKKTYKRQQGLSRIQLLRDAQAGYIEINYRFSQGGVSYAPFQELEAELEILTGGGYVNKRKKTLGLKRGNLSRLNKSDLKKIIKLQEDFLASPWSTPEGRRSIIKNSYSKFSSKSENSGISESAFLKTLDILNSGVFGILRDLKNITSDIIVQLVRSRGVGGAVKVLNDFMEKYTPDRIHRMSRTQIEDILLNDLNE